mgnify:CR=1 FL=1
MGIRVPRITVNADFGDDTAFGDLSLLSVGYGLHQAWVYAVMFGTPTIFGTQTYVTGMYGSHASLPFLVSIVVFGLCLLFAGITDQRPVEDVHLEEDACGGRGAHVGRNVAAACDARDQRPGAGSGVGRHDGHRLRHPDSVLGRRVRALRQRFHRAELVHRHLHRHRGVRHRPALRAVPQSPASSRASSRCWSSPSSGTKRRRRIPSATRFPSSNRFR